MVFRRGEPTPLRLAPGAASSLPTYESKPLFAGSSHPSPWITGVLTMLGVLAYHNGTGVRALTEW
ncbi:hypothetical protein [Haloprofundus salinisoli]|uniref:hypothetical protein n=1 Tax=Haloprofundus salinisoli TaxID=2876193 RepID=UPI001CCB0398|nr:hypothetical protein [Haloprofundus salinisoli]